MAWPLPSPGHGPVTPFSTLPGTIRIRPSPYNCVRERCSGEQEWRRPMEQTEHLGEYTTFIVRVWQDDAGRMSGVVERVRTGEKVQFHGLDTLSRAVASLLSAGSEGN